jgi:hypothetical protein
VGEPIGQKKARSRKIAPSLVHRIGLPRLCASTRRRSSTDLGYFRSAEAVLLSPVSGSGWSPLRAPSSFSEALPSPKGSVWPNRPKSLRTSLGPVFRIAPRSRSRAPRSGVLAPHLMDIALLWSVASTLPFAPRFSPSCSWPGFVRVRCASPTLLNRVCSLPDIVGLPKRSHQTSPESSPCPLFFRLTGEKFHSFVVPVNLLRCTQAMRARTDARTDARIRTGSRAKLLRPGRDRSVFRTRAGVSCGTGQADVARGPGFQRGGGTGKSSEALLASEDWEPRSPDLRICASAVWEDFPNRIELSKSTVDQSRLAELVLSTGRASQVCEKMQDFWKWSARALSTKQWTRPQIRQ